VKEVIKIIKELVKELKILNEHLRDFKKMVAHFLGWKVMDDD